MPGKGLLLSKGKTYFNIATIFGIMTLCLQCIRKEKVPSFVILFSRLSPTPVKSDNFVLDQVKSLGKRGSSKTQ